MIPWELHGLGLANCNCAFGCPCQFMSLPTYGHCEAIEAYDIESGRYGDVDLAGTRVAIMVKWPGAIHEGEGTIQIIIDESASPDQREALHNIMSGEDTAEAASIWWVFAATCPERLPTLFKPIDIAIDLESRKARLSVPGVLETDGGPVLNPVSGEPHRARINLPEGFQFRVAEVGRGTTKASGDIALENIRDSHLHLSEIHASGDGVIKAA